MTILKPPLALIRNRLSQKIVIDRSMTILKPPLARIRNRLSQKIVIDWSMTILKASFEIVIDWSMTILKAVRLGFGQSRESLTYLFDYGHTTYGQMSFTTVNDKNLWTKL